MQILKVQNQECNECGKKFSFKIDKLLFKMITRKKNEFIDKECIDCNLFDYYKLKVKSYDNDQLIDLLQKEDNYGVSIIGKWLINHIGVNRYKLIKDLLIMVLQPVLIVLIGFLLFNY